MPRRDWNARPDHLILLRETLERARARGVSFEAAWPGAVRKALRHVKGPNAHATWAAALAGTKLQWWDAYNGDDVYSTMHNLHHGCLDDVDEDRSPTWGRHAVIR